MEKSIEELQQAVNEFCEERDWTKYHNAKDLALSMSVEASELAELFLWVQGDEINAVVEKKRDKVCEELADVFYHVLRIAYLNKINLSSALLSKLEHNAKKYPVSVVKGKHHKYTEY